MFIMVQKLLHLQVITKFYKFEDCFDIESQGHQF